jgi:hypothetical protein
MKGLIKTLIGDGRTVACVAVALAIALVLLETSARLAAGIVMPLVLLAGAAYLARH